MIGAANSPSTKVAPIYTLSNNTHELSFPHILANSSARKLFDCLPI